MNGEIIQADVNEIRIKQPLRSDNGDLTALQVSIRKLGLLNPVIVDKNMVLISGGRRLTACRDAGLTRIPALKLDIEWSSMTALDIQSDDNLCRMPLSGEDLENHIRKKKTVMEGRSIDAGKGLVSWFKGLLSRKKQ